MNMKQVYKKPKAILVDFHYDEQVTASSNSNVYGDYGNASVERCQYYSGAICTNIFNSGHAAVCDTILPFSYGRDNDIA